MMQNLNLKKSNCSYFRCRFACVLKLFFSRLTPLRFLSAGVFIEQLHLTPMLTLRFWKYQVRRLLGLAVWFYDAV